MIYYPEGVSERNAPWNEPDSSPAWDYAYKQVTGQDASLTFETLCEFFCGFGCGQQDARTPPLVPSPALVSPISTAEVLMMMAGGGDDQTVAAAARELVARYLASPYTQRVIASEAAEYGEEERPNTATVVGGRME